MDQYRLLSKIGDGAFSEVFMAQEIISGKHLAIKCMKKRVNSIEEVKRMKEIRAYRDLSPHEHIVQLIEVCYDERTGMT